LLGGRGASNDPSLDALNNSLNATWLADHGWI